MIIDEFIKFISEQSMRFITIKEKFSKGVISEKEACILMGTIKNALCDAHELVRDHISDDLHDSVLNMYELIDDFNEKLEFSNSDYEEEMEQ